MPADLDFDGERYLPGTAGGIACAHWHRYAFARRFATGRRGLDAALQAQERLIAYQRSFRWWLHLPWMTLQLGWQRRFGK